jgi:hypothetical protein
LNTAVFRQRPSTPSLQRLMSNPENEAVSSDTVAKWMLEEVEREELVYQETLVSDIETKFGETFTYINENGNAAISKDVLEAFRRISVDTVVWERQSRSWRKREACDEPGRQQP